MQKKPGRRAFLVALPYAVAVWLWLWFSNPLARAVASDPGGRAWLLTWKDPVFAGATAVLLFFTLRRALTAGLRPTEQRPADQSAGGGDTGRAGRQADPDGVAVLDMDGTVREMNPAGLVLMEAEGPAAIEGKSLLALADPEQREAVRAVLKAAAGGARRSLEFKITGLKGTVRWLEMTGAPFQSDSAGTDLILGICKDISERKRREEELSLDHDLFQTLLDSSPDHIYFKDAQSRFIKTNKALARKFNLPSPESMLGKTDFDLFAEDHARAAFADEQEIIRTGRPMSGKVEKESWKDGRTATWVLTARMPLRNRKGETIGTIGISKDISALKQAEEELLWKTAFFETLVDSVAVGVLVVDDQGKKIIQNELANELLKIPRRMAEDPDDREQLEFVRSQMKDPEAFARRVSQLYAQPNEVGRDLLELIDGTLLDRYSAPVRSKAGKYYGRIWIFRDITREKNSENALRLSEAQLRATFDGAAIGIALIDMDGRLTKSNPALAQMLGYSATELGGKSFAEITHPDDLGAGREQFRALLAGSQDHYEVEKRLVHKNGELVWGRVTVSLVRQTGGAAPLAIAMVENVTERRSLEEQVRQSQKMEAVGLLASGVAHDFNNVLAVIQLQAGVLGMNDDLTPAQQESALEIVRAAERAANLTRQLLLFSRKQSMQAVNLNLNQVVGQMTKMLQRILNEDISLVANYAPHLPLISADAGMMEQILMNLAVNSRDAMPKGGKLTLTTGTARLNPAQAAQNPQLAPGLYVRLTVTDTGAGIAAEHLPHIFEPFFTTKGVGKGTGLGLATVYGIVEQHRGWINVTSKVGEGTTFNIYFPAVAGGQAEAQRPAGPARLPQGTETIFVVEDASAVRTIVCHTLRRCGYNILQAESGREALEAWPKYQDQVDLLLTDIVMPNGLTGFELAKQLQASKPSLKVIYTSGYSGDLEGNRGRLVEGLNFLQKPYPPQKLAEAVRKSLDQK